MEYLILKEITPTHYGVWFQDKKQIGDFIMGVDGSFYFWNKYNGHGCMSDYILIELGNKLKNLNKKCTKY